MTHQLAVPLSPPFDRITSGRSIGSAVSAGVRQRCERLGNDIVATQPESTPADALVSARRSLASDKDAAGLAILEGRRVATGEEPWLPSHHTR
jgi:hypothetical protein